MTELKPKTSLQTLLTILLIFTVVSGILPVVVDKMRFSGSLVFIGLALFSLYLLLRWSMRPRFFIESERPRLGETTKLKWEPPKAAGLAKQMRIDLVGQEVATERVGSSSKTHKNNFARIAVVDTGDEPGISVGECEVQIPLSLPSFKSTSNKVIWSLEASVHLRLGFRFKYNLELLCLPPAPVGAFDPIKPYANSVVQIYEERVNFAPGEQITGLISLDEGQEAELQLLWFTEGKGNKDSSVVQRQPITDGATSFQFKIPANATPSFSGRFISLVWALKLVAKRRGLQLKGREMERVRVIVSPTGEELTF